MTSSPDRARQTIPRSAWPNAVVMLDARAQAGLDLGRRVADGRDDAQPGDDDAAHESLRATALSCLGQAGRGGKVVGHDGQFTVR